MASNHSGKISTESSADGLGCGTATSTASSLKQRQTSLRNFFGASGNLTKTISFQEQKKDRKRTAHLYPLTPPTPVSPQTPATPPTFQADATIATPPSPVAFVLKKARRETIQARQTDPFPSDATKQPRRRDKKALEQTYLDLGQGDFGKRTICGTCGMLYVHGLNEDSQQHSRICLDFMKGVPFNMPQARQVSVDSVGSIVEVRPTDNYALRSKLKRVLDIVDRDLGFVPSNESNPRTAYLYVVNKRIVGLATAEIIPRAYVLHNLLQRSSEPQRAMAGVHQLWVHSKFRKQGIATRLIDAVRAKLVFGLTVPAKLLAFSSPTEAGARFAHYYVSRNSGVETCDILVYDCC